MKRLRVEDRLQHMREGGESKKGFGVKREAGGLNREFCL
jgi:hypothetical protein